MEGIQGGVSPRDELIVSSLMKIKFSVAEQKSHKSWITGHSEVDRLSESAFRAPQDLPVPAHWTKSGLVEWAVDCKPVGPVYDKKVSRPRSCGIAPRTLVGKRCATRVEHSQKPVHGAERIFIFSRVQVYPRVACRATGERAPSGDRPRFPLRESLRVELSPARPARLLRWRQ